MLQLLDNYSATYTTLLIGLIECIALLYVYGKCVYMYLYSVISSIYIPGNLGLHGKY